MLAKGLHEDSWMITQAMMCGADFVLTTNAKHLMKCCSLSSPTRFRIIYEPMSLDDLIMATYPGEFGEPLSILNQRDIKVCWNQRDLATGKPKAETFAQARGLYKGWLCQASLIKFTEDISSEADAVLIGEHLKRWDWNAITTVKIKSL